MNPILNTAFKAARKTGHMITRAMGQLEQIKADSKTANDFIADVENTAADILADTLTEAYPHHKITIGNNGSHSTEKSEYEWVIAPLDGITNFAHSHPQYAISMALVHKGRLQEALVYAPERNDCYMASRGQGALLNDRRIRVANRIELHQAVVGTTFSAGEIYDDQYFSILKQLFAKTSGIRSEGATSLELCALACGRIDGFLQFALQPYDVAAGALIVQEAGGIVTDTQGNDSWLENGNIVAANPKILAKLIQLIQSTTA